MRRNERNEAFDLHFLHFVIYFLSISVKKESGVLYKITVFILNMQTSVADYSYCYVVRGKSECLKLYVS